MSKEIATVNSDVPATVDASSPVGEMFKMVLQSGNIAEATGAIKEMAALYRQERADVAKMAFNAALCGLQQELDPVRATRSVDGKYKFASRDDIMRQVRPLLTKHGFAVTYSSEPAADGVTAICQLSHTSGHSEEYPFKVRTAKLAMGNNAQADGATLEYARRYALCSALDIQIDKDNDARAEGACISQDQATSLRDRVAATKSDEKSFLAFAGAKKFEEIRESKWASLDAALSQKESEKGM